ncbi:jg10671 [Pararge aegeria aegeria]|uniref:Jg10671 protein n=1 Tax=Pararge aegeria aegeria TaxID=348720 RepID=A0A8S4RV43_9NEOP|nr:jg10671 [Pararge aegeria aegeria]
MIKQTNVFKESKPQPWTQKAGYLLRQSAVNVCVPPLGRFSLIRRQGHLRYGYETVECRVNVRSPPMMSRLSQAGTL